MIPPTCPRLQDDFARSFQRCPKQAVFFGGKFSETPTALVGVLMDIYPP